MFHPVGLPGSHRSTMTLVGALVISVLLACSRYSGNLIRNQEDALALVGSYRQGDLTESRFLGDWPMLENQPGEKYEWVWGILKTSSSRLSGGEVHSYWVGFFDSDVTTFTRDRGSVVTVRDSSGVHISQPAVETVVQKHWVGRKMWRLDFQDSVLSVVERAESP